MGPADGRILDQAGNDGKGKSQPWAIVDEQMAVERAGEGRCGRATGGTDGDLAALRPGGYTQRSLASVQGANLRCPKCFPWK